MLPHRKARRLSLIGPRGADKGNRTQVLILSAI